MSEEKEIVVSETEWLEQESNELQEPVQADSALKELIVGYVGRKLNPKNNEVTLEMVIETFAEEFDDFLLPIAEENFIRGYKQAISDIEVGEELLAEEFGGDVENITAEEIDERIQQLNLSKE